MFTRKLKFQHSEIEHMYTLSTSKISQAMNKLANDNDSDMHIKLSQTVINPQLIYISLMC